jgi:penicillin-binding protein 1A
MISFQQLINLPQLSLAISADDQCLGPVYTEYRVNTSNRELPNHLKQAFISAEDKRFFSHKGFDPIALLRASWRNLKHLSIVQGGSTITQQLARIAIIRSNKRTIQRKIAELLAAIRLERIGSKEDILEAYLNAAYFGNNIFGVRTAAWEYFRKYVSALDLEESAYLAGIIRAPNRYLRHSDLLNKRKNRVLELMHQNGFISRETLLEQRILSSKTPYFQNPRSLARNPKVAIYYVNYVRKYLLENHGDLFPARQMIGKTAYDKNCQEAIDLSAKGMTSNCTPKRMCSVIIEKSNGMVKAVTSGTDPLLQQFNIAIDGYLQPGSTIKPFILTEALRQGFSLESKFESKKICIDLPGPKTWEIKNFNDIYRGTISLSEALISSDNTVFTQLILRLNLNKLKAFLKAVGIDVGIPTPALATGATSRGTSPLQIACAYTVFSNGGYYLQPTPIIELLAVSGEKLFESKVIPRRVIEDSIASEIDDVLRKVVTHGTGVFQMLNHPNLRAKTGTTNTESWYVSYDDKYHLLTWVGDDLDDKCKMVEHAHSLDSNLVLEEEGNVRKEQEKALTAKQLAERIWKYLIRKNNLADFFGIAEGIESFNSKKVTELEGYFMPWGKYGQVRN